MRIYVNNGYTLNVMAQFDSSISEVTLRPKNVLLTSNTPYSCTVNDNAHDNYHFTYKSNGSYFYSEPLYIYSSAFSTQPMIQSADNNDATISENSGTFSVNLQNSEDFSCPMDENNRFCNLYHLSLASKSKLTVEIQNSNIQNVITTFYDGSLKAVSPESLPAGNYYISFSNGDGTIMGGYLDATVTFEPLLDLPSSFENATLLAVTPDSTKNLTVELISSFKDASGPYLSFAYKINLDRCCSVKIENTTFTGKSTDFWVDVLSYSLLGPTYYEASNETVLLPGTYYIEFAANANSDAEISDCLGNLSCSFSNSGNYPTGGGSLTFNGEDTTLYAYRGQLLDVVLTKTDPTSTARIYPMNMDFPLEFHAPLGESNCFVLTTSADGMTKKVTNSVRLVTCVPIYNNTSITVKPTTLVNGGSATISSDFYVDNQDGYSIPDTSTVKVTVKNETTNTELGIRDLKILNVIPITGNVGDTISFSAEFIASNGTNGPTYSTTFTLA